MSSNTTSQRCFANLRERLRAVVRLAEAGLGKGVRENLLQTLADDDVVIHDQDADFPADSLRRLRGAGALGWF